MPGNPISAVFFDLDETLLEHIGSPRDIVYAIYGAHAEAFKGIDADTFAETLWRKAHDMWHMMFDGVLPGTIARANMFKNTLRELDVDIALAEPMMEHFESAMLANTRPYPGVTEVLAALANAGLTTGIITNGYIVMQNQKIDHHGLRDRVHHILISQEIGAHKPDRRIFEAALSKAKAAPDEAIHVGDNLANDIEGALGAGMHAAHFNPSHGEIPVPEGAHRISKLAEVLQIVGLEQPSRATK